ncbi:uncharacterized protein A4U43_C05F17200 [Asparagus officinalis]|uniref:DUF674 family protein n=1 Tax=Asparagus officinalis TaxID=4686 RepID=A0A5P1EW42_ASPOF|nr:uncharacterized protein LOC109843945 [Asparagus officinalis]ONK68899.1 uncharacterized protein A4U43_C05F17200 [Asparagus officinalis]
MSGIRLLLQSATCYFSSVPNVRCSCGKEMSYAGTWPKKNMNAAGDGVFVRGGIKFIVSDELHITLASTAVILSLFSKKGIKDGSMLEERIMDIGHDEILKLLERSLISSTPLTDLCFDNSMPSNGKVPNRDGIFQLVPKCEEDGNSDGEQLKAKLLLTKTNRKIVYMECDEEVLDFLFSFLTFPLGAVIKLLNKSSSMGCADNLYGSAEVLSSQENLCIKSEECKTMLLGPKLAPFCGVKTQLLKIGELVSRVDSTSARCFTCYRNGFSCGHRLYIATLKELNPKFPNKMTEPGGGYAKGQCKFMVTDDLDVALVSPFSTVRIINEFGVSISNLVEEEVGIGETQALNLLKAALCSETALTKVFSSNKRKACSLD